MTSRASLNTPPSLKTLWKHQDIHGRASTMSLPAKAIVSRDTLSNNGWKMEDIVTRKPGEGELLVEMVASGICRPNPIHHPPNHYTLIFLFRPHRRPHRRHPRRRSTDSLLPPRPRPRRLRLRQRSRPGRHSSQARRSGPLILRLLHRMRDLQSRTPLPLSPVQRAEFRGRATLLQLEI